MQSSFVRLDIAQKIVISPAASRNQVYWSSRIDYRLIERIAVYFGYLDPLVIVPRTLFDPIVIF